MAQHFKNAGQTPKRLIGLDTSPLFTHPGGIWPDWCYSIFFFHAVTAERFPSVNAWNNQSAEKVELYKSSWWYSMGSDHLQDEASGEVYGLPAFFVVKDEEGSFKGDLPVTANPHHGFSREWFTRLMEEGDENMTQARPCDELYKQYSGIETYERGTFGGVLRFDGKRGKAVMECGAALRDELGVNPKAWRLETVLGHPKTMHELQERMALLTEYRMDGFAVEGGETGRLVNGETANVKLLGLKNAADNISTHFPSLVGYSSDRPWDLLNDGTGMLSAVAPQVWAFELSAVPADIVAKARGGKDLTEGDVESLGASGVPLFPRLPAVPRAATFLKAQSGGGWNESVTLNIAFGNRQAGRTETGEAMEDGEEVLFVAIPGANRYLGVQDKRPEFYPYDLCRDDCPAKIIKVYDGEIPPTAAVQKGTADISFYPRNGLEGGASRQRRDSSGYRIVYDGTDEADASGRWTVQLTGVESTGTTNIVAGRWAGEECSVSAADWSGNPNVSVMGTLPVGADGEFVPVHAYEVELTVRDANGATNSVRYAFEIHRKPDEEPEGEDFGGGRATAPQSCDPNEMAGPAGAGSIRAVAAGDWMNYTIYFENKSDAGAAAQFVAVDAELPAALDWETFEMGDVGFGLQTDTGLRGKRNGTSEVQMEGTNLSVRSSVALDAETGRVSWFLRVVTPEGDEDGWPYADDPTGFLPPNDEETHCGEGHISYRVKVRADVAPGERIDASASIVFDYNDAIVTEPAWWNIVAASGTATLDLGGGATTNVAVLVGAEWGDRLPDPGKNGWMRFAGWFTGPEGTGEQVTAESLMAAGVKLYAFWTDASAAKLWVDMAWENGSMKATVNPACRVSPFEVWSATGLKGNAWNWTQMPEDSYAWDATNAVIWIPDGTNRMRMLKLKFREE